MKFLKSIGLFCIYPIAMFLLGFYGNQAMMYFLLPMEEPISYEDELIENDDNLETEELDDEIASDMDIKEAVELTSSQGVSNIEEYFYLKVENHYITVYKSDGVTVYINTEIRLDELPETVQQEIIEVKFIQSVQSLYDFLETYSS